MILNSTHNLSHVTISRIAASSQLQSLFSVDAGPDAAAFLFPFRKPKRIRTAFSPSQLLQLEEAFGKNHYVVGQERKDLAASLNLTETQVSTYFDYFQGGYFFKPNKLSNCNNLNTWSNTVLLTHSFRNLKNSQIYNFMTVHIVKLPLYFLVRLEYVYMDS